MNSAAASKSSPLARDSSKKLVLFYRDFRAFTGGHLKVWDYFNHVASSSTHEPRIAFSGESKWDATNPWYGSPDYVTAWKPEKVDVLFLASTDWRILPESERRSFHKPIVNLIQHPRHAETGSELCRFLENRAVRICVSEAVADAIKATEKVNGPVFVIPNGIDLHTLPRQDSRDPKIDVLISGLKAPELARKVHAAIAGDDRVVECLSDWIPRDEYLARLRGAKVTVFLPRPIEGFYLPALEGMACGTIVVCPDCKANRGFCDDGVNCFRPRHDLNQIIATTLKALHQPEAERTRMRERARATVLGHSLDTERASFLGILGQVDDLWER